MTESEYTSRLESNQREMRWIRRISWMVVPSVLLVFWLLKHYIPHRLFVISSISLGCLWLLNLLIALWSWRRARSGSAKLRATRLQVLAHEDATPEKVVWMCGDLYKRLLQMNPKYRRPAERRFIADVLEYMDIYVELGASEKAERVRALALAILDSPKLREHS